MHNTTAVRNTTRVWRKIPDYRRG